jgi:putative PIN family toxin of toxin-antitoxin system
VRLVPDTNTAVSALLWGGPPGQLIDAAAARQLTLSSSLPLLAELGAVLDRPKFAARLRERAVASTELFDGYAALVQIVVPTEIGAVVLDNSDDDMVLATAVAANADMLVSGDSHLLAVGEFRGIPVITASAAARRIQV